jgi:hypothetical protein
MNVFVGCLNIVDIYITDLTAWCQINTRGSMGLPSPDKKMYLNNELIVELVIPEGITKINSHIFSGYGKIKSLFIPESLTQIHSATFYGCFDIEKIIVSEKNETYSSKDNCLIDKKNRELLLGCKNSIIPSDGSVVKIGANAFSGNINLTNIIIPDSIVNIGNNAFYNCINLTKIILPSSITTIGSRAFKDCVELISVMIYCSNVDIRDEAFIGCDKLIEIYNFSSLNIEKGSEENGYLGFNALDIYVNPNEPSKIVDYNGYLFYDNGEDFYLLKSTHADSQVILPKGYNDNDYHIYKSAFRNNNQIISIFIPIQVKAI